MATKGEQLQIRITARQKATLKRKAAAAGLDVSTYVLACVLPSPDDRFARLLRLLASADEHRLALAELNDLLAACPPIAYAAVVEHTKESADAFASLSPFLQNYVAAMVEHAAHQKELPPPSWTGAVEPLSQPWFASELRNLRRHLLVAAPVAFKRRNLFVDATIGDRV